MMIEPQVILVDEQDCILGYKGKMQAHKDGDLHRAISVLVFNDRNELLLQQRAAEKYHSANLWTNTCCSHPMPDEQANEAASRRLQEEMGMHAPLQFLFKFTYRTDFDNGLTEHEVDYVFVGRHNEDPVPNPEEASSYQWMHWNEVVADTVEHPERYTSWFRIIVGRLQQEQGFLQAF